MAAKILEMKFDPKTIKHLGVHQYSTLPPVISELVSNCYDAEAEKVTINLNDTNATKQIIISDNGHGMSFDEINDSFLLIGRNRRLDSNSQKSKNDKRFVVGKKGIGKLSFFGIAEEIEITTTQNHIENCFLMDWSVIEENGEQGKSYNPVSRPEIG
ncbi:MAG: ATP-binding protein [Chitinophagales bacterium]|nr:ATP-binding protein [Chitinophagales bacterium]